MDPMKSREVIRNMKAIGRVTLCLGLLSLGFAAQAGLESASRIERPPLRRPLATLPVELGGWSGRDEAIDPAIRAVSEATDCLSRTYTNPRFPGVTLSLWINYSSFGGNMRHSPETCLPMHGSAKIESMTRVLTIPGPDGKGVNISRLAYTHGEDELVQAIGFWYYIFGESGIERWVRTLPITSRSSHGRTTRGSGMTVEVFWASEGEPDSAAFQDFAQVLVNDLGPILPEDRAAYHVP
jgi:hypothetical protein